MSVDRARALLAELVGLAANGIDPDDDLVMAGIDSGDLIRLALGIEERYQVELEADRLAELRSLSALAGLLASLDAAPVERSALEGGS